jgi:hypothetical protein
VFFPYVVFLLQFYNSLILLIGKEVIAKQSAGYPEQQLILWPVLIAIRGIPSGWPAPSRFGLNMHAGKSQQ